jgi:hypothetical protein
MLINFAFSHADHEAALRLARFLKFVPNEGTHDLLLATTEELVPVRNEIEDLIGPLFSRVHTVTTPKLRTGWPEGPNSYFHFVAKHIHSHIPCEGWYFFEAGDSVPTRPGWLDELEADYRRGMRPVMGFVHPSYRGRVDGKLVQDGNHVVGCAVYSRDLPRRIPIFDNITVATLAFDVFLQWYLMPLAHSTRLIDHQWQTAEYKTQKDGTVVGIGVGRRPAELVVHPVDWSAAVIHGVKDDSLLNIVRGRLAAKGIKAVKIDKKKKNVVSQSAPTAPVVDPLAPAPFPGSKGGWK